MEMSMKKKNWIAPVVAVVLAAVIITIALFIPPYVGMEDNRDFSRVIYPEGLYDLPENSQLLYTGYFIKEYGIMQYFNQSTKSVYSSQTLFIQPAIWMDKLLTGNDNVFDLRYLGIMITIYFLIALYFLVDYLTYKLTLLSSLLVALVSVIIFVDTGYIAYFNSFYAEQVAYVSFIGAITCALLYAARRYNQYVILAGFVINGLILTFSKQQLAPIGAVLGIVCLFFYLQAKGRLFKVLIAISSAALMFTGIVVYLLISTTYTNINMFHAMTRGVLMTSDNPAETLETLDIKPEYELLNGTIYYDRYPTIDPEDERMQQEFYSQYGVTSVVKYYLANPDAFVEMMGLAAQNAYTIRPNLGNYEYASGYPPKTQAQVLSVYSRLKKNHTPKTSGFIIIWMVCGLAILYKKRLKQIIVFGVMAAGLSQFVVSIVGAGDADLAKHIFLYNVAFDLVNVILLAHGIAFLEGKYRLSKGTAASAEADIDDAVYKNT